jgi:hypothetical protein
MEADYTSGDEIVIWIESRNVPIRKIEVIYE